MGSVKDLDTDTSILLNKLKLEEDGNNGFYEFDMGVITHPKYGSASIKGTIPAVLSQGIFQDHSQESRTAAFRYIVNWLESNQANFGTTADRDKLIKNGIDNFAGMLPPSFPLDSPAAISMTLIIMTGFYVDDLLESTFLSSGSTDTGEESLISFISQPLLEIANGKYSKLSDVPPFDFPMLQPILWFAFLSFEEGKKANMDLLKNIEPFSKQQAQMYETFMAMSDAEFMSRCSEDTYLHLREYDVGSRGYEFMMASAYNIQLSKKITSNVVYKRLRKAHAKLIILCNDLFGMEKEMELDTPFNFILRRVSGQGQRFQEAVDQTVGIIQRETKDFMECAKKLVDSFPNDENLARMVEAFKYTLDGQLHMYENSPRWGQPKITFKSG